MKRLIFIGYVAMITITGGHAWHGNCSEPSVIIKEGRWVCSAAQGVFWPIYWLTQAGIYIMDPNRPSVRQSSNH